MLPKPLRDIVMSYESRFPTNVRKEINGRYVLVAMSSFNVCDPPDFETDKEHKDWFHAQWWKDTLHVSYHDTGKEAEETGLDLWQQYPYECLCWIVWNADGEWVNGCY